MNYFYLTGTPVTTSDLEKQISTFIPLKFAKRSGRCTVTTAEDAMKAVEQQSPLPDTTLMNALARAFHWQRLLDRGIVHSGTEIARKEQKEKAEKSKKAIDKTANSVLSFRHNSSRATD